MKKKLASFAPPAFVAFAFLISRWLYIRAGLHFDNTPPRYYYQFVDPELLKERLWESLWYLHSQPPLFNFMTGLLYQFFSPQSKIYQLLFLGMGLVFGLSLYWLGLRLGLRPWISALLAAWFMVSPATILYENLYFYTYPVAFLLVLAALMLSKFLETDHFWWGLGFFSVIAGLCLTWGIFHLTWMLAVILLAALFSRDRRRLVLASLIPVLLVSGWYVKNYLIFGSFSASSWAGMNLSHVTFLSPLTSQSVREALVKKNVISSYPVEEAFRSIEYYRGFIPIPEERGVPVLDESIKSTEADNFNHTFYLPLSRRMAEDAVNFVRARPDLYLDSVWLGLSIYFHSSSDYLLLKDKPTPQLENWWDRVFYWQSGNYGENPKNRWNLDANYVGWGLVIGYLGAVAYGLKISFSRDRYSRDLVGTVSFMTFTILYFTLMANFFDLGENNRFRFSLDPLVLMLFGMLVQNSIQYVQKRRSRR